MDDIDDAMVDAAQAAYDSEMWRLLVVTEADVRRIVREELERAGLVWRGELNQEDPDHGE